MKGKLGYSALAALASLVMTGCARGDSRISLLLTDAPGDDVRAANVTIDQIYLQPGDAEPGSAHAGSGDASAEPARVVLRDQPITTDLVTLANDTETLVDDISIPPGTYAQLRFVINGAAVALARDGGVGVWSTPGYAALPEGAPMGELKLPITLTIEDAAGDAWLSTSPPLPLQADVASGETTTVDIELLR